jgi:hypothetical protein
VEEGDGCDGQCMVEPGWACSGGTDINSDLCRPILMPAIEKVIMTGEMIRIYFNTTVLIQSEFQY